MSTTTFDNSPIVRQYREQTSGSNALFERADDVFPSGITHDARRLRPYGIYVERAEGSRKWDVDGNEYVDYFGGHGALLMGHNHPEIMAAVQTALTQGTHFGSSHEAELRWGEAVKRLVPSAERIRFTSSGTEATHLALRLARAHTGRTKVVRFLGHFHGWHDHMAHGYSSHFDGTPTPGVLASVADSVLLLPPGDVDALEAALAGNDIAAVIMEPTGSTFGLVPMSGEFLEQTRRLTALHNTVLIFDEVVTGFRVSPGGAQAHFGVTPDLTTLAKILAGGLPGGAVAGSERILDGLDYEATADSGAEKIQHQGTYNANPVSAAAGLTALNLVENTDACAAANAFGETLRQRLNALFTETGTPWAAYGTFSGFHIFTNPRGRTVDPEAFDPAGLDWEELKGNPPDVVEKLRLAMMLNGVDITGWPGGTISAVHTAEDQDDTVAAFRASIDMLKNEGEL